MGEEVRTGAAARHEGEPSALQLIEQPQLPTSWKQPLCVCSHPLDTACCS